MTDDAARSERKFLPEQEFLAQQVADAQAAIEQTLNDLRQSLKTAVDLRLWTRQHPWACVGMAAAAGFAAAHAVATSSHEPSSTPSTSTNRLTDFLFDLAKESLTTIARTVVQQ